MRNGRYNLNGKRIIISRTDSLGDVVLCLPVAGVLRRLFPQSTIIFLGKAYTRDLITSCEYIDEFADWEQLRSTEQGLKTLKADAILHIFPVKEIAIAAKDAQIPLRIGSTGRLYHWGKCNKLVRLSRRHSSLHEAQLNLKLLVPLGAKRLFRIEELNEYFGMTNIASLTAFQKEMISTDHFNLILHPGSKGSAREWGVDNFAELIRILPKEKYKIFLTGSQAEGELLQQCNLFQDERITNLCGKFSLSELISFIANADGIVAASTGPLHIAAVLGRTAIGIYPPIKPMHPGRWAPLGPCAYPLVSAKKCSKCRKSGPCSCMKEITPEMVRDLLFTIFR